MSWDPSLATQQEMSVDRVALLRDEARVYLRVGSEYAPQYVLRLLRVFKMFDRLPRGQAVQICVDYPHGSFGWDVPGQVSHYQVKIKGSQNGFLALAREIEFYTADNSEALNWPG